MGLTDFLFKEKEERYLKQIEDLQNKLKAQEEENSKLRNDIKILTEEKEMIIKEKEDIINEKERDTKIIAKQLEIFEKNLKQKTESSKKYKDILVSYKINTEKIQHRYKVDLKNFYSEKKFEEIVNIFNENNIFLIDELTEENFSLIPEETKNLDKVKQKFLDYKNGKFDWEVSTLINRGEKLSKVYAKSNKLIAAFSDLHLEYIDDIADFDFMILKSYGFKTPKIEEFIQKRDEYYKEKRY